MPTMNVPVARAGPRVEDVMLRAPRTLSPTTTVAEARQAFENPRERLLLVARGETFLGAIDREALAGDLPGDATVEALLQDKPRVTTDDSVSHALELLDADGGERLPVVEPDGRLVGLVCFNRRRGHFCVDARES
jgi:CBS domain-containing protein